MVIIRIKSRFHIENLSRALMSTVDKMNNTVRIKKTHTHTTVKQTAIETIENVMVICHKNHLEKHVEAINQEKVPYTTDSILN